MGQEAAGQLEYLAGRAVAVAQLGYAKIPWCRWSRLRLQSRLMGSFSVEEQDFVLHLSGLEKLEGMRGDIRVPRSSVRAVRWVADPWPELRGIRAPGTGFPGVIAVGTRRGGGIKDFAAVHGRRPAVVVELDGSDYDRFVVTDDCAEARAAELAKELGLGSSTSPQH